MVYVSKIPPLEKVEPKYRKILDKYYDNFRKGSAKLRAKDTSEKSIAKYYNTFRKGSAKLRAKDTFFKSIAKF